MKVCYFDESGTGEEPVAVVTGVVVDTQRMHVTKQHWADLLDTLSDLCGKPLEELHTKDFYRGTGPFKNMEGADRAMFISEIVSWFCERKHDFVYSAILKDKFKASRAAKTIFTELETPWRTGAFHCVLALQRAHQTKEKTKGHTLLVFDNKGHDEQPLTQMVLEPPAWSDTYYGRKKKETPLSQIVDAPYFADSCQVPMLQLADFLAYLLRRYVEIGENLIPPKYADEKTRISDWVNALSERCIGTNYIYPAKGRCATAETFYVHCPSSLRLIKQLV